MSDPRNVAHDKKVIQAKKHHHEDPSAGAVEKIQPGKKPEQEHEAKHENPASARAHAAEDTAAEVAATVPDPVGHPRTD